MTVARQTSSEIEVAIATGKWEGWKRSLTASESETADNLTIRQFSDIYFAKYCQKYNRRPDFKKQTLQTINRVVGGVPLKDFGIAEADALVAKRIKEVAPATVDRGLAVLKNMLNFAVREQHIDANPLSGFKMLPEEELPLRILTLEEERQLVESVAKQSRLVGAYTAVLGETGLRKSEGLRLQWPHVDLKRRMLTVSQSKNARPRYIPLSSYAVESLMALPRYLDSAWVFTRTNGNRLKSPRCTFKKACRQANLEWVRGFHDLRNFRATMWLHHGVDIHTVRHYLGHRKIETTMRYLHFVEDYAERSMREAQRRELEMLKISGRQMGDAGPHEQVGGDCVTV